MTDITTIPLAELKNDLVETIIDIAVCRHALGVGVESYSGGSVQDRLEGNMRIRDKIERELLRRTGIPLESQPSMHNTTPQRGHCWPGLRWSGSAWSRW